MSKEYEVENVDNEALLKSRLSTLRTIGNGNVKVLWNSDISKFTLIYLKPV